MRTLTTGLMLVLAILIIASLPSWAGNAPPERYFGIGSGYPDYGSASYFLRTYPEDKWSVYGYGTGFMGMGYGPYIYGGRNTERTLQEEPGLAYRPVTPKLKWIGGNQVQVNVPAPAGAIKQIQVDVLAFNGAVLETGTVVNPPFVIIAQLPEGAASIRVYTSTMDGFSSVVYPIVPTG